ncbi:MAG: TonB-dependent receptor [Alphaproteobacteria bacterium]|nr:TonB-dependent receptor [Alphaproteobacteria bacterium]
MIPRRPFRIATAAIALTLAAGAAGAQTALPDTVVTATRIATPPNRIASTIAVITADDIARKQYRTIDEALRSEPSLAVARSGGPGKLTSIFSRGANSNHTLVLLDGIELNDPSTANGAADLGGIALDDVERIEVLYGSQGTLYGSDAIGAVINIITKEGKGKPVAALTLEGGSFGTFNQAASVRGSAERLSYAFNVQHLRTTGLSATTPEFAPPGRSNDDDAFDNITLGTKLGYRASDDLSFNLVARHSRTRNDLDLNVFPVQSDDDSRSRSDQTAVRAEARLAAFDKRTEHRLGVSYTRTDRRDRDDRDPVNAFDFLRDRNLGTRTKIDLQNDLRVVPGHVFTLGLETESETIDSNLVSDSLFGPFSSSADASNRTNAIFLQDQFTIGGGLFGTVGVRVDDHERFGTEPTWRVAVGYRVDDWGTTLRGSYSTGFKAPSLFQLFGASISGFGTFLGNPNLEPERSAGYEIGVTQRLLDGRLRFGLTWFDQEVENLIVAEATTNRNVGRADLDGIEASVAASLTDRIDARLGYSFVRARDRDSGNDLLRRPRHRGSADLAWRASDTLTISSELIYVGNRRDIDAATFATIRLPSYALLGVTGAWRVHEQVTLFGRVANLLDVQYEDPDGFAQPGIGAFVGVRATY